MNLNNLILIIILFSFISPMIINLYTSYLWFIEVGYVDVFLKILSTRVLLFVTVTIFYFIIIFLNVKLVENNLRKRFNFIIPIALVVAFIAGLFTTGNWETVLRYFNQMPFGIQDPVFNMDISFYVFSLPFYSFIWGIAFFSFLVAGIISLILYLQQVIVQAMPRYETEHRRIRFHIFKNKKIFGHLSIIGGIIFLFIGAMFFLQRYDILNSTLGTVNGAGLADISVVLPYLTAMSIISGLVAIAFFISAFTKIHKIATFGIFVIILSIIIGNVAITLAQLYKVLPDEFNNEKPFLERNIQFTRLAYQLDNMKETEFPALETLTVNDIENNAQTIGNIRLWDWRPMLTTYKQLQLIRTYYNFNDVDVDRYTLGNEYKQVLISAREVDSRLLPDRSWINTHLVFTHGYGTAVSPVREVSTEGLPKLIVRDIPPKSEFLEITQPEIYFGELTNEYVVVNSKTEELDYPKGEINVYTTYQGTAGIPLNLVNRLAMTLKFGSFEILFSDSITPESKIVINRNIEERVSEIAPFLAFDMDPYIVIADGKLYWIIDTYTTSSKYPYSEYYGRINYIRNPVKVVIDAYSGDVTFYVIEEEPIIKTYMNIFPELFVSFDEMPESLKSHIRYPVDLFKVQAEVYKTYHMRDPRVFYNKEDVWETPKELYERTKIDVEPYYLIMQLPGEEKEEFILLTPFTPRSKNNMIGWIAARSDSPNYGERMVFLFPKEKLIFGPIQIEARIDQNPEISQKFTLWNQIGTRVVRGNLLVVPIEESILYIEPIYLRAEQEGAIPELKRVIVAYGDKVTMQETLEESLATIFGKVKEEPKEVETRDIEDLISEAVKHYNSAQEFLKSANWEGYGIEQEKLREVLEELSKRQSS